MLIELLEQCFRTRIVVLEMGEPQQIGERVHLLGRRAVGSRQRDGFFEMLPRFVICDPRYARLDRSQLSPSEIREVLDPLEDRARLQEALADLALDRESLRVATIVQKKGCQLPHQVRAISIEARLL